jgi:hypothetical protein
MIRAWATPDQVGPLSLSCRATISMRPSGFYRRLSFMRIDRPVPGEPDTYRT